jgi:hypothetical protein
MHNVCYNRLKDRCINMMLRKWHKFKGTYTLFISGARQKESKRRMHNTSRIEIEGNKRMWVSPCYDWTSIEQRHFMEYYRLDKNPVKISPIAMSGECFCGAFARPGELELIKEYVPDVFTKICELTQIANPKYAKWGSARGTGEVVIESGPLCSSCDFRATKAGLIIRDTRITEGSKE